MAFCLLYGPAVTTVCDHWEGLDYTDLCRQSNVSVFNTLSRFVIAFLPRSNHLLISWLQSPSTVILEPKKRKSVTTSTFSPFYLPRSNGARCHDLSFLIYSLKPDLSLSSISLHCSCKKALLSLLAILWNSAFSWASFPFSFSSLHLSAI